MNNSLNIKNLKFFPIKVSSLNKKFKFKNIHLKYSLKNKIISFWLLINNILIFYQINIFRK
jgi:hypothetical protein